jgi:hypothetical protein
MKNFLRLMVDGGYCTKNMPLTAELPRILGDLSDLLKRKTSRKDGKPDFAPVFSA